MGRMMELEWNYVDKRKIKTNCEVIMATKYGWVFEGVFAEVGEDIVVKDNGTNKMDIGEVAL